MLYKKYFFLLSLRVECSWTLDFFWGGAFGCGKGRRHFCQVLSLPSMATLSIIAKLKTQIISSG